MIPRPLLLIRRTYSFGMKVGDLIQIKNHNWGEQPSVGLVTGHRYNSNGFDVWNVTLDDQEKQYYLTHELLVISESR